MHNLNHYNQIVRVPGRSQGDDARNREAYDDGVRGAPIEGDNVKVSIFGTRRRGARVLYSVAYGSRSHLSSVPRPTESQLSNISL